ncbi:MAG: hypothetical protein KDB60_06675 [Propionibacteriaceae bacterium]|nr:hypothetical protein [Propionibacteriaceae bacterium]
MADAVAPPDVRATPLWQQVALGALIFAVGLASALRGLFTDVRKWGVPNIYLNYSQGLVRRGLVGEVIRLLGLPESRALFAAICWAAGLLTLALLAFLAVRATHLHPATTMLLIASQLLPTLAFNTGYLDPFICVLVILTYYFLARDWMIPAAVAAVVAPFVHEQFIFYLLPVLVLLVVRLVRRQRWLPHLVVAAAAVVGTLVIIVFDNKQAGAALMQASPMRPEVIHAMIRDQLGQTLGSSLQFMANFYSTTWKYSLVVVVFMIAPAVLMLVFNRKLVREAPWLIAAAVGPLALLAVAWDLSRFAVMAVFACFVVLAVADSPLIHGAAPAEQAPAGNSVLVGALLSLGYLSLPFFYSYPQYGYVVNTWADWFGAFLDRPQKWPYRP